MLNELLHQLRAGMALTLALLVSGFSLDVAAQTTNCRRPSVYYVNGIQNTFPEAQRGSYELSAAINERFPEYGGVRVQTIHNPTNSVGDFAEVAIQQSWLRPDFLSAVAAGALPSLREYLNSELLLEPSIRQQAVIDEIKRTVLADIRLNAAPVILIAHSQGNMYVNQAVYQLKTNPSTRDISGVQTIAVLGIGVADRTLFRSLQYNSELYRYITASDDLVIGLLLDGVPPTNFQRSGLAFNDPKGHSLVDHYLAGNISGQYQGATNISVSNARSATTQLFGQLYQNAARAWPCISLTANPNPALVQQDVSVVVVARERVSFQPLSGAQMSVTVSDSSQSSSVICSQPTNLTGSLTCNYRFLSPPSVAIRVKSAPAPALPPFESEPFYLAVSNANFEFQVTDNPIGAPPSPDPGAIQPICRETTLQAGDGEIAYEACVVRKDSRIRCVGPGCASGRFWVSVTASRLSTSSVCGFAPVGGCVDNTSIQENWGVEPGAMTYIPGSLYHFNLLDGVWTKGSPMADQFPLGPPQSFSRNFKVIKPLSPTYLYPGFVSGGSLDLTYSIFDTWTGATFARQNRVTVP